MSSSTRTKVELPTHEDGELVDYLEEDPELPNQRYCIVSFISPEKVIEKKKAIFYLGMFLYTSLSFL